ncbi:MAG: DUF3604 domain-containing protein, partial [Myxococcota bacterium]|nr:DUF3604 domain-containing protein [Myxococcota bacterium]
AGAPDSAQILFGDLHVHSGFSLDALAAGVFTGGEPYTVSDACDFARYCSALDFWSINDHAMNLTPRRWRETIDAVRECDARGSGQGPPDVVPFLGWEWTQAGTRPENHFGHKNVILRDLGDGEIPTRPIAADSPSGNPFELPPPLGLGALAMLGGFGGPYLDAPASFREMAEVDRCPDDVPVRELPDDCREWAATPGELFAKLDDWGFPSLVIPHGTTWGNYTPPGSSFSHQLRAGNHDPERQRLIEIFSGHGNAEGYRPYRAARFESRDGEKVAVCPEPSEGHLPACWHAGEIIRGRCLGEGETESECEDRAREARRHFLEAPGATGHLAIGGYEPDEWLDADQCRDCFLPAFNHRPGSSVQAILAAREPTEPERFRFGVIGSSDTHTARAGSGYKELARVDMTDARLAGVRLPFRTRGTPLSRAREVSLEGVGPTERGEVERLGSFFYTGGLAAVHASDRSREGIWNALMRREVYGTSGPRILLWFDLMGTDDERIAPMGGTHSTREAPRFRVRAVGSFEQEPGCPDYAVRGLGPDPLERLCRGECWNPSDRRRPIDRIEVVRIRPRAAPGEPLDALIEDPWRVLPCDGSETGCRVEFEDPEFSRDRRDAVYYVRAIEAKAQVVNAGGLRCETDDSGACVEPRACRDVGDEDDCLGDAEPRAWSSPIFVDWRSD